MPPRSFSTSPVAKAGCTSVASPRQYARQDEGAERQLAALESCLERLPPKQRQLVEQRYSSGVTVSGLATQSGREVNAVSATLYRIRQALAECIQKKLTAGESP